MNAPSSPRPFVIYADQRSGSTWLRQMLDSHPEIHVEGEVFLHHTNERIQALLADPTAPATDWAVHWSRAEPGARRVLRPWYVFAHLDRIFTAMHEHAPAVGFKLMYDQSLLYPETLWYLLRRRVGVVHLVRENHLDVLLSRPARRVRGVAHSTEPVEPVRIQLDPTRLCAQLRRRERVVACADRFLRASRLPHVRVTYEAATADSRVLTPVLAFLGVTPAAGELRSENRKLNTLPHWEMIENYDAVRRTLAGTRFARFLQTPPA